MVDLFLHLALPGNQLIEVSIGVAEGLVNFLKFFQQVHHFLNALFHDFANGAARSKLRLLFEHADRVTGGENYFAGIVFVDACNDAHQGRFSGAIQPQNPYFSTVKEGKVYVF